MPGSGGRDIHREIPDAGTARFPNEEGATGPAMIVSEDRRKSRQLLARWRDARGTRAMPSWECHAGVVEDLGDYCITGHFGHGRTQAVTCRIGTFFLDRLEPDRGAGPVDPYSAAVVMGIVRSLGTQLLHKPSPILHDGEFQTNAGALIRFRTVVLPFGEPGQGPDHWLALGGWCPAVSEQARRVA
ncbi:MAG: hypothetical protein O3A96_13330 [Proteobacteria bacterium]|nr:hypothetical protein [Pseudomonadota bacterium]